MLDPVRGAADLVIDTTDLNIHQLKDRLVRAFDSTDGRLRACRSRSRASATSTGCRSTPTS